MLHVVLIALVVFIAAAAVVAFTIFFRAAFRGERERVAQETEEAAWRPPFLQGSALRDWAAATTEKRVTRRLAGPRTAQTASEVITELSEGASHAMMPLARAAEWERVIGCPAAGQGAIGVTAIEALALAAELRRSHSITEVANIQAQAVANARALTTHRFQLADSGPVPCPLHGENHLCSAYAARPLHCRPLHASAIALTMASRRPPSPHGERSDAHERLVAEGMRQGLSRALHSAGLDATAYEFNNALAVALESPEYAARWAKGENVFARCPPAVAGPT